MPVAVVMPKLGLTMASGTVARWIKQPGEPVRAGEPLLEVATDKINYEVEAPASGTLVRALGGEGEEFACGAVIGSIALAGDDAGVPAVHGAPAARLVASPAARRLARERRVALAEVRGSGPHGRITLADVQDHAPAATLLDEPVAAEPLPAARAPAAFPPQLPAARRAIYRAMSAVAQAPLAQVETAARVDAVHALMQARGDFGWTAFAVFALARLLREDAALRTDATTGAPFERIDIGVAADTPHGLIVPVVRGADVLPLAAIQREIARLAAAARAGATRAADVGGACFSLSNVGPQGIERVAPLPDPPQTAILGIGAATQRAAVADGALVVARLLTCVLTFDHRFVDGAPAARFLAAFARACAEPGRLL